MALRSFNPVPRKAHSAGEECLKSECRPADRSLVGLTRALKLPFAAILTAGIVLGLPATALGLDLR